MKQAPSLLLLSPGLRRFLYVTAMITGGVVLVIEILGAKMLTPWFGSSHFVWTAQITITLLALAAGYYVGGWLADRYASLPLMYAGLMVAAAYLSFTVLIRAKLASACLGLDLALGSIVASLGLYFVPLTLLAAVGPYFIRILARSLQDVGRSVGRLSALGTVGSVVGVLVTSYLLVPYVRDSVALLGTAAVLVGLSAVYYLLWGRGEGGGGVSAGAAGLAVLLAVAGLRRESEATLSTHVELELANSHFGTMRVVESRDGRMRMYLNDNLTQNTYDPVRKQSLSMFTYALVELSKGYTPDLKRALCIGMGVGIAPRHLAGDGIAVDVVEINPRVVPLAQRWFDFDPSRVNLFLDDARHFLRVATNRYDTVQLDAFLGDSSPSHLMTREAFSEIRRVLNPGGTLVINSFADFNAGRDFFGTALHKTLGSVFAEVRVHASPGGNMFFVASDRSPLEFRAPASLAHVQSWVRPQLEAALSKAVAVDDRAGLILTDDFNPVDYFDASNREATRRSLARGVSSL
ncbi:MAG: fused MFS/spermidine synthase [Limisphaerales bacterium]